MLVHPSDRSETAGTTYVVGALGHRLRILFAGTGAGTAAAEFARVWHHLLVDGVDADRELTIEVPEDDPASLVAAQARAAALVTLALIELNAGRGLLFHAAAATDTDGRAVLLVGPSGAGKTTAVAHLARPTRYLTDETALIDDEGWAYPYPKPLSVAGDGQEKTQEAPADLGLALPLDDRIALARVLIVERDGGADRTPEVTRLGSAEGILSVVPQLSSLSAHPTPLAALARLNRRIGGFERLGYSDVHAIDPADGVPSSPRLAESELAFSPAPRRQEQHVDGAGLVQAPSDDAIDLDGTLLIAHGGRVSALAGIARTIWLQTARPTPEAAVLEAVRAEHGRVPDDERHFRRVVEGLTEGGLLEWRS